MTWRIEQADAAKLPLEDQSVDLVFGSPPYCDARSYGIGAQRDCREWIDWMMPVVRESCRVSRGLVLFVCAGVQHGDYWPACEGLAYRWWAEGGHLWKPAFWHRTGIPGSGGRQWLASRIEYILAFKHEKGRIAWADYKANGQPPKYPPGGKLSYRDDNGVRRHKIRGTSGYAKGDATYHATDGTLLDRAVTDITNPGNLLTSCPMGPGAFVAEDGSPVLVDVVTGGGKLGHKLAHENEAPFPLKLAEWFIRGWCPHRVCTVCGVGYAENDVRLRAVRTGERAESREQPGEVLLETMCGSVVGAQSTHDALSPRYDEGVRLPHRSESPCGNEAGICDGTPSRDGKDVGSAPSRRGSGPPQRRGQGQQCPRELGTNDKILPRSAPETPEAADVPALWTPNRPESVCVACGGRLRAGIVCDSFSGSGTTAHAAFNLGRHAHCFDLRLSQVFLGRRRMREVEVENAAQAPAA